MNVDPYRVPAHRDAPERMVWETVHVTNVAYLVLSAQSRGWKLVAAEYVVPLQTQKLVFERV